jgi:hypothetical protein
MFWRTCKRNDVANRPRLSHLTSLHLALPSFVTAKAQAYHTYIPKLKPDFLVPRAPCSLHLANNELCDRGCTSLSEALAENQGLTELDVAYNKVLYMHMHVCICVFVCLQAVCRKCVMNLSHLALKDADVR